MTPEICIMCTAINRNGSAIISREYNLNRLIDEASDYALLHFMKELKNTSDYAEQTVRVMVDIALPARWYDVG